MFSKHQLLRRLLVYSCLRDQETMRIGAVKLNHDHRVAGSRHWVIYHNMWNILSQAIIALL